MGLDRLVRKAVPLKAKLTPEQLRGAKPTKNPSVTESLEEGQLILRGERMKGGFLQILLEKSGAPNTKGYELEEVGAFVWGEIDGKKSFEKLSKALQVQYKMNRLEADVSLSTFLQMLSERGLITLLIKK